MLYSSDKHELSLPDYKDNPEAYEIEERSRPDEMLMLKTAGKLAIERLNKVDNAKVLDLCCGTGLSIESIVKHPNISLIVGVDISQPYLDFAINKYSYCHLKPEFILGDALSVTLPKDRWDLIILASAYHHIEDKRKVKFLKRVNKLLDDSAVAIIAENILPSYQDKDDYAFAVRTFYTEVLHTAKKENPQIPKYVENLIKRVAQYGFDGNYEYKVSLPLFLRDLEKAQLKVVSKIRVWPSDNEVLGSSSGNYVFEVVKV